MAETHVGRILRMLQVAIRMLGLSNREVERRLEWTPGYMTRILKGTIELKVDHLVDIAGAIGLSPREMLLFAFPDRGEPPSAAALQLEALMDELRPASGRRPEPPQPEPKPVEMTPENLDQRIESALQRFFAKMAGKGS
jgi:hypothetical protein